MRCNHDSPPAPVIILGLVIMVGIMYPPVLIGIGAVLVLVAITLTVAYRRTRRQLYPYRPYRYPALYHPAARLRREIELARVPGPGSYPPVTLNPNGQPSILPAHPEMRPVTIPSRPRPCTEGGPCRPGHRRVVYALDGTTRVAVLCTKCGRGTPDQEFLTAGTTRLPSPIE